MKGLMVVFAFLSLAACASSDHYVDANPDLLAERQTRDSLSDLREDELRRLGGCLAPGNSRREKDCDRLPDFIPAPPPPPPPPPPAQRPSR